MNKLELLRTFVRVTELSSFTGAGESLGLPRSTVSEHVQALEELLGARLLQRTTRKVQATQDGRVLYERSKDLLAHMEELEGLFRQDEAQLAGRIRVDMPNMMARDLILPRLPQFMDAHPLIELEISTTDRQVDLLAEGFDCVLRVGAAAGPERGGAAAVQHADDQLRQRHLPATLRRAPDTGRPRRPSPGALRAAIGCTFGGV